MPVLKLLRFAPKPSEHGTSGGGSSGVYRRRGGGGGGRGRRRQRAGWSIGAGDRGKEEKEEIGALLGTLGSTGCIGHAALLPRRLNGSSSGSFSARRRRRRRAAKVAAAVMQARASRTVPSPKWTRARRTDGTLRTSSRERHPMLFRLAAAHRERGCHCRYNAALEAARKGEDLWIDLSSCSVHLAKAKKVRARCERLHAPRIGDPQGLLRPCRR